MGKLGFAPGYTTSVWIPEAEDLWNVGQYLPDYRAQHPRRQPAIFKLVGMNQQISQNSIVSPCWRGNFSAIRARRVAEAERDRGNELETLNNSDVCPYERLNDVNLDNIIIA
jgi:hypothetical protein